MSEKYNKKMTKAQLAENLNIARSTLYVELNLYKNGRNSGFNDVFDSYFAEDYDTLDQCIKQVNANYVPKDNSNHDVKIKMRKYEYFKVYTELYPALTRLMVDIYNKNVDLCGGLEILDDMLKDILEI